MNKVDLAYACKLPPEQAITYFRAKGYAVSFDWHEILKEAHAKAFTVAKATRLDILQDIRSAVDKALAEGQPFKQFQKELTPILQKKGWWGRQELLNEASGELRSVQLGSAYRLRTIYQANLQTAYMAGRYKSMMEDAKNRPYWMYVAVMDSRTRPAHRALNGKVFRYDDPFWKHFYPPNGWRCRCRVRALTAAEVESMGLTVESTEGRITFIDQPVGEMGQTVKTAVYRGVDADGKAFSMIPDTGWDYNPGQTWQQPFVPRPVDSGTLTAKTFDTPKRPISELPAKPLDKEMMLPAHQASGWSEAEYVDRFLAEFGTTSGKPVVFHDAIDDAMVISEQLFMDRKENVLKVFKADREIYLKLLADTIKDPVEIWMTEVVKDGKTRLCKRYVGIYRDEKQAIGGFVVFDMVEGVWQGTTAFRPRNLANLDKQRDGALIYAKQ